jgi:hypothetical protein
MARNVVSFRKHFYLTATALPLVIASLIAVSLDGSIAIADKPSAGINSAQVQATLDKITSDLAALIKRVTAIEAVGAATKIADLQARLAAVESKLADIQARLVAGEAKSTESAAQIAGVQTILIHVDERLKALETPPTPVPVPVPIPIPIPTPTPTPVPVPTPAPGPLAADEMKVKSESGAAVSNYPLQIGRAMVQDEITRCPQVVFNGTPVQTQATSKNRYLDGSWKFGVISAVLPSVPTTASTITFRDQACDTSTPITVADLLAKFPDFDAVTTISGSDFASITGNYDPDASKWGAVVNGSITLVIDGTPYTATGINLSHTTDSNNEVGAALVAAKVPATIQFAAGKTYVHTTAKTVALGVPATGQDLGPMMLASNVVVTAAKPPATFSASARQMLEEGNCKPWTSGPVEVVYMCGDRSAARKYDMGFSQWRSFHPEFELSFWPTTNQVSIRYVGEVTNTEALEAFAYDLKLTSGKANPATVYQQSHVQHSIATRWSRPAWLGGTPEQKISIDHNVGYLADTRYIANYDRSLKIPDASVDFWYNRFMNSDRSINGPGLIFQYMPNVGYHPDIGLMPVYYLDAVYTGDWRALATMFGNADLFGAFSANLREGDPNRFIDRAKTKKVADYPGKTATPFTRPQSWGLDVREGANPDTVVVRSPAMSTWHPDLFDSNGFTKDNAHVPDPYFVPYILSGDPFYLDGLQLWAGFEALSISPGCGPRTRCGATGVIEEQVRGDAWMTRTRSNAWMATPDDDPMKQAFSDLLDDQMAHWEGQHDVHGTKYEGTPQWKIANDYYKAGQGSFALDKGIPPLHQWQRGSCDAQPGNVWLNSAVVGDPAQGAACGFPEWMQDFLTIALGRAYEMGFDGALGMFQYSGQRLIGAMSDPAYSARLLGFYNIPDVKWPSQDWFRTWAEMATGFVNNGKGIYPQYWPNTGGETYWDVSHGAVGISTLLPGGLAAYQKYNADLAEMCAETKQCPDWNGDPTWAIVPRTK